VSAAIWHELPINSLFYNLFFKPNFGRLLYVLGVEVAFSSLKHQIFGKHVMPKSAETRQEIKSSGIQHDQKRKRWQGVSVPEAGRPDMHQIQYLRMHKRDTISQGF